MKTPEERQRIVRDHLDKCLSRARQFKRAMQIPATTPENVSVYLFAGDSILTNSVLAVDPESGSVSVARRDAGDGKIPVMSARQDLRTAEEVLPFLKTPIAWTGIYHLPGGHMGIMNSGVFESNLFFLLLSLPTAAQNENMKLFEELSQKDAPVNADGSKR